MIRTRRGNVTTCWSEIVRAGKRITKTRSVARDRTCYEYWGYRATGVGMHKLGRLHRERGTRTVKALRGMQGGTQLRDFAGIREAENWIAECDCWAHCNPRPKSQGGVQTRSARPEVYTHEIIRVRYITSALKSRLS